jgi:hypothetical protein
MTSTTRNFAFGTAAILALIAAMVFQTLRTNDCDGGSHTVLVLVDFTDALSADARFALKDHVWRVIEDAPDFSWVVLRPILGKSISGSQVARPEKKFCRGEKPDFTSPWKGAAKIVREKWGEFKVQVCGAHPDGKLSSCGDALRSGSFFEQSINPSANSPILEQIVDDTRRFLKSRDQTWDLLVATDWRQNTEILDLHNRKCSEPGRVIDLDKLPLFTQDKTRLFSGSSSSSRVSTISSLFIPRADMDNEEADCLINRVAFPFFMNNMQNAGVRVTAETRLPRS